MMSKEARVKVTPSAVMKTHAAQMQEGSFIIQQLQKKEKKKGRKTSSVFLRAVHSSHVSRATAAVKRQTEDSNCGCV